MTVYLFQVIQTSRDPSLAISMLLEPYGVASPPYKLNRNKIYTSWKPNPVPFDENNLTDKSQCKKNSATKESTLFSIQNQWQKVWFECPIHGIINSGQNWRRILVRYVPFFLPKKLHNDFFWKWILVKVLKDK